MENNGILRTQEDIDCVVNYYWDCNHKAFQQILKHIKISDVFNLMDAFKDKGFTLKQAMALIKNNL
jgi:hypothetical protein